MHTGCFGAVHVQVHGVTPCKWLPVAGYTFSCLPAGGYKLGWLFTCEHIVAFLQDELVESSQGENLGMPVMDAYAIGQQHF